MTTVASRHTRIYTQPQYVQLIVVMSSIAKRIINWAANPSDSFKEFLEGYADTYDLYSACSRRQVDTINYDKLADDFWRLYLAEIANLRVEANGEKQEREGEPGASKGLRTTSGARA